MDYSYLFNALANFAAYFLYAIMMMFAFVRLYIFFTPQDDWQLIRENNLSAAMALSGAALGYAFTLASAAIYSISWVDFCLWSIIGMFSQFIAYQIIIRTFCRELALRIEKDEVAAATILVCASVTMGLLNAVCMSY